MIKNSTFDEKNKSSFTSKPYAAPRSYKTENNVSN